MEITSSQETAQFMSLIDQESARFFALKREINKVIVGQEDTITFALIALLCNGHILLEGVPGIAKTTLIKTLAKGLGVKCSRIQFTPDLLPADLIGTLMYNPKIQDFETKKGPLFANMILADEINRAPAKVQAALLEAMEEHQVTIGSTTYRLDEPFLVFATQNPIEQEGTYRLPEAQVDRFMFKLLMHYPTASDEKEILARIFASPTLHQVLTHDHIFAAQKVVRELFVDEKIVQYIVNLVAATRSPQSYSFAEGQYLMCGVSPRATIALYKSAQAHAFLKRRHFVIPDDVKAVAGAVLRHRLVLTYEAETDGVTPDKIIKKLLDVVPSP